MTATATLVFDKPAYAPGDTIRFQVVVDGAPMSETMTVAGMATMPNGTVLPVTSSTTVHGVYGPFTADGYTVVQDATDPSRFTATPGA